MPTDVDIAWASGLFEGEGCIEIHQRGPARRPDVALRLNTTDRDVLERFAAIADAGKIRKWRPPSVAKPHWKVCWMWRVRNCSDCERLLNLWRPYLGERRGAKAREALAILASAQRRASWKSQKEMAA